MSYINNVLYALFIKRQNRSERYGTELSGTFLSKAYPNKAWRYIAF